MKNKVPKLRFPEFSGEWEEKKLGDIGKISSGLTPLRSENKYFENGDIPWIKTTDLNNGNILKSEELVTILALKNTTLKILPIKTILIAMYGGFNQIGRTGLTQIEATINQAISSVILDKNYFPEYILQYLNGFRDKWKEFAASSRKDPNITKKDVENFKVSLSSFREQQEIANFLSSVDIKIEKLERKVELLKDYKKGMMQKLFSQELRFKDENGKYYPQWEENKFGNIFERINRKNKENNQNVLTISAQNGLISQLDYFNKSVAGKSLIGYYLLEKGDFAYNKSYSKGYPVGAIKKLKFYEKGVVSSLYICFKPKVKVSDIFYEYYFENGELENQIKSIAQEGARNHGLLNIAVSDFFDYINISLPSLPEQEKIANFLSSLDNKIDLVEKELEKNREFKKGLLQQMFV